MPWQAVVEVPDDVPLEQAAILADAVATPYAGLTERGGLRQGESVGLWGIGGLGVHAVQIARMVGAAPIIALDPLPAARDRALEFGADHALDPTADGVEQEVLGADRRPRARRRRRPRSARTACSCRPTRASAAAGAW